MSKLDDYRDDLMRWRSEHKSLRDMEMLLMERGLDVSKTTIHKKLCQWGAPATTLKAAPPSEEVAARNAKIYRLHEQHVDRRSIAERFGLTLNHVRVIVCNMRRAAK